MAANILAHVHIFFYFILFFSFPPPSPPASPATPSRLCQFPSSADPGCLFFLLLSSPFILLYSLWFILFSLPAPLSLQNSCVHCHLGCRLCLCSSTPPSVTSQPRPHPRSIDRQSNRPQILPVDILFDCKIFLRPSCRISTAQLDRLSGQFAQDTTRESKSNLLTATAKEEKKLSTSPKTTTPFPLGGICFLTLSLSLSLSPQLRLRYCDFD